MDKYQLTAATFDRHAKAYEDRFSNHAPYLETYQRFCELIDRDKPAVLDAGCGPGIFSRYLLDRFPGCELLGIDLAPQMLELARQKNPEARFECRDVRQLAGVTGRFDIVVLAFCFPYLSETDVLEVIAGLKERLKPDGWVYISLTEGDPADSGLKRNSAGDRVFQCYHSPARIREALRAAELEIIEEMRQELTLPDRETERELFLFVQQRSGAPAPVQGGG